MKIRVKSSISTFFRECSPVGWVALSIALVLVGLIFRGLFVNTPEHTVTPLSKFSVREGIVDEVSCGETPAYQTILYFQVVQGVETFEVRTNRYECGEFLKLVEPQSEVRFWVHPTVDGWVGQLVVNDETVIPHSDAYEEAWDAHTNFTLVGGVIALWLLYYALLGQFRTNPTGRAL